jgi:hypothetical protein
VTGGTGGAITIPSVEKVYLVNNSSTGNVVVTTGAGTTATLASGEMNFVVCDAVNVRVLGVNGLSNKAYVDATAWSYNAGNLPAQAGANGKFLKTNGAVAGWALPVASDLSDYATAILGAQVALAAAI